MKTVYISIGNSDDKLGQAQWVNYIVDMNTAIFHWQTKRHGYWHSPFSSQWQNACWCVEISERDEPALVLKLREIAGRFGQDSIAWAEVKDTKFLGPLDKEAGHETV